MLTSVKFNYNQKIFLNKSNTTSSGRQALLSFRNFGSIHTFKQIHVTYVTLPLRIITIKRSMQIAKYVIKNHLIPKSHSAFSPLTPKGPARGMAAMHGGRLKKKAGQSITSKGTSPESDLTGAHELTFMSACHKKNCKDQNCATGTQLSTGTPRPNPCNEPPQYHQQPVVPHGVITIELAGNATSRIPSNKDGIVVDSNVKRDGSAGSQELVTEKNTVSVPAGAIKENTQSTAYYQKDDRTKAIIDTMPADSILNQK